MEAGLAIQQVAELTGLSIDTLRYYERIGLLEPIRRAQSGHRRYSLQDISWIDLLIRLRNTGMPRAQMIQYAELRRQGPDTATERRIMLEQHQRLLEQHMRELEGHMAALHEKIGRVTELEARQSAAARAPHARGSGEAVRVAGDREAREG